MELSMLHDTDHHVMACSLCLACQFMHSHIAGESNAESRIFSSSRIFITPEAEHAVCVWHTGASSRAPPTLYSA